MTTVSFTQQPAERLDYDIRCNRFLSPGDYLQSVSVTVDPPDALDVEALIINQTTAKLWVSGGVEGGTYKIEANITTHEDRVVQTEVQIKIKDY